MKMAWKILWLLVATATIIFGVKLWLWTIQNPFQQYKFLSFLLGLFIIINGIMLAVREIK